MGTQVTARLSDLATAHRDRQVSAGTFDSRAASLTWLLEREAQRAANWQELLRLKAEGALHDRDTEAIVQATSGRSLTHLD